MFNCYLDELRLQKFEFCRNGASFTDQHLQECKRIAPAEIEGDIERLLKKK
jgi:hypothetical protein